MTLSPVLVACLGHPLGILPGTAARPSAQTTCAGDEDDGDAWVGWPLRTKSCVL